MSNSFKTRRAATSKNVLTSTLESARK